MICKHGKKILWMEKLLIKDSIKNTNGWEMQAQCFKRYRSKKKITTYEAKDLPVNFTFTCAFSQFFDTYFQIMNISHLLCVIDILVLSGQRQFELRFCPGRVSPSENHDTRADLADQCLVQLIWIRRTRLQVTKPRILQNVTNYRFGRSRIAWMTRWAHLSAWFAWNFRVQLKSRNNLHVVIAEMQSALL